MLHNNQTVKESFDFIFSGVNKISVLGQVL